jgi:uncharacterized SAM-binding protein YcdF (DUF218 family)
MVNFYTLLLNNFFNFIYPTIFLCFVIVVALIFWKKRFSRVLLGIGALYFYFSANGMMPTLLTKHLEKPFKTIDTEDIVSYRAMIVLGGGISFYPHDVASLFTSDARILEAYRIYNAAQAHHVQYTIFLSGGYTNKRKKVSEAELYKRILIHFGIPSRYIVIENRSLNTYQNAEYLKPILEKYPFHEYLLVSSALHMRRAQDYFNHFDIKTVPAPSDYPYPVIRWLPRAYNLAILAITLHEYIGICRLKVYNYFNVNS